MAKQLYLRNGNRYTITDDATTQVVDSLPPKVFTINTAPFIGYFFEETTPFEYLPKYYGELPRVAERVISTYKSRLEKKNSSTGVLLSGEKGGGKTLLAKKVALDLNLPVILVNEPFCDNDFKSIIAELGPAVVIFDEFEKIYNNQSFQNSLLTLMDGVYPSECLFFVIVNESHKLTDALKNRPGRLFYSLEYKGLTQEFIKDYCEDVLQNKNHIKSVQAIAAFFINFNFDMLQGLVEEMNRYGEDAHEAAKYLNISASFFANYDSYDLEVTIDGKEIKPRERYLKFKGNPLASACITVELAPTARQREMMDKKNLPHYFNLTADHISKIDQENNVVEYKYNEYICRYTKSHSVGWTAGSDGKWTRDVIGDFDS